ncbi:MAG: two-component regulator propeller domain-containing protein, partial [Bacteroidota bacterium]
MCGGIRWLGLLVVLAVGWGAEQAVAQRAVANERGTEREAWTPRFERAHDVEPHLPQSSVYEILEDRRGFLWFATREGLGRWDGYTMRTWRVEPFNAASLPGNVIHRMLMDGAGSIWAEAQNNDNLPVGVARLAAPDHERVQRYGFPDGRLFVGPDSIMWLADRDSLYRHDAATDRFVAMHARLTDYLPASALTRRDGSVWLPTYGPVVEVYDLPTGVVRLVWTDRVGVNADIGTNTTLGRLFEDARGDLWLTGEAISRLTPEGDLFETHYAPVTELQAYDVETLGASELVEADGWIWVATLHGVYRFRPGQPEAPERYSLLLPGDIATQNYVTAIFRDRAGAYWAGTVWGLHRADPYANPFRLIAHDPSDPASLGSGLVLSLQEDEQGALWVGTLGGGLNRLDLATGQARRYPWDAPGGTNGSWIWDLGLHPDGTLYISASKGLDRIDTQRPDRIEPVPVTLLSDLPESVYAAHVDVRDGSVWVGQRGGLMRLHEDGEAPVFLVRDSVGVQHILTEDTEVWIATLEGLYHLDRETEAIKTYRHDLADPTSLSHDATLYVHRDARGRLWVGTNSGLNRYLPETDTFVHYTTADGLPSDAAYAILED